MESRAGITPEEWASRVEDAEARWEQRIREIPLEQWQAKTRTPPGMVAATVAFVLALVGMVIWPLGAVAFPIALVACVRARGNVSPFAGRAIAAATLAGVEVALVASLVMVHFLPGN